MGTMQMEEMQMGQMEQMESNDFWLARDKDGPLFLYDEEPVRSTDMFTISKQGNYMPISQEKYTNVTWENSPVKLKLVCT